MYVIYNPNILYTFDTDIRIMVRVGNRSKEEEEKHLGMSCSHYYLMACYELAVLQIEVEMRLELELHVVR